MVFKVFIDTNIILDVLQETRPHHETAKEIFYHLAGNRFTAFYSESVITTLAYVLRKYYDFSTLNHVLDNLNTNISLLACSGLLVRSALRKNAKDFEDALLYEIALQHKMDYFLTSNIVDFQKIAHLDIPIVTSKELLKLLDQ
jgi:predicted nucleic acid-binding protein